MILVRMMSKCNLQRALRIERNLTDSMKELLDTGEITKHLLMIIRCAYDFGGNLGLWECG